ncbi:MAG: glycoside hydrolase family 13 protein [Telluria sp.]
MKRLTLPLLVAATLFAPGAALAQDYRIEHMEPPFWWAGMQHKKVQLMVHGKRIADLEPSLDYRGASIESVTRVPNRNYLFVNLLIADDAAPGKIDIVFSSGPKKQLTHSYQLLAREPGSARRIGFNSTDAIYQIMPDRFANGDPSNDNIKGMGDPVDRASGGGRHGGDIKGVIDSLDYIASMGFTQIWPTPLVENAMPSYSYHGYAATDHYKIDPRYGSNEDYRKLSREARKKGIGIIQDVVLSHIGTGHWWMKDMPTHDWISYDGKFIPTAHHRLAGADPYGSKQDRLNYTAGWFGSSMPDMNQTNPLVANYLIQNNIWWIEYAGLSGLRIDTYGYSDYGFLTEYTRRLMDEYPKLNMVGEEWHTSPVVVSRWQKGKVNYDGFVNSLPSLMDYPLAEAMRTALPGKDMWIGFNPVYETLAQDYMYPDPGNLVLFEGNHDIARLFSVVGEDLALYKMNLAFIMTMPRIPQFYYGTELLMTSTVGTRDDASYRRDFPGGWAGDKASAFTGAGLSVQQREAQAFVKKLVNWRKTQPLVHHGKTMQFGSENGTWVYFRYDGAKKVMVAFNKADKEAVLPTERFREMLAGVKSGVDVITGKTHALDASLTLPGKSFVILEI